MGEKYRVNKLSDGPTIKDLELILKRIEELDLKLEGRTSEAPNSKQAA